EMVSPSSRFSERLFRHSEGGKYLPPSACRETINLECRQPRNGVGGLEEGEKLRRMRWFSPSSSILVNFFDTLKSARKGGFFVGTAMVY
ncbi:MAG: hypothetical protein ACI3YH_03720, partial [Eubacteriales bacterium]